MPRKRTTRIVTAKRVLEVLNFDAASGTFSWKYRDALNNVGKVAGGVDQCNRQIYLGRFDAIEPAIAVRVDAERQHFGEFGRAA